mmetsp:Transcript_32185/g.91319  ORF Transcript_32185/g.91319 Transcript_32185/m.91319 type:complete len:229 (+) Transcript_32185:180-866(+)
MIRSCAERAASGEAFSKETSTRAQSRFCRQARILAACCCLRCSSTSCLPNIVATGSGPLPAPLGGATAAGPCWMTGALSGGGWRPRLLQLSICLKVRRALGCLADTEDGGCCGFCPPWLEVSRQTTHGRPELTSMSGSWSGERREALGQLIHMSPMALEKAVRVLKAFKALMKGSWSVSEAIWRRRGLSGLSQKKICMLLCCPAMVSIHRGMLEERSVTRNLWAPKLK